MAADGPLKKLESVSSKTYNTNVKDITAFSEVAGKIINGVLGILGVIFILLMLYAGYNWMTAAGQEQKVEKAKDTILRAIIGLLITISSYAIWNFILTKIIKGT